MPQEPRQQPELETRRDSFIKARIRLTVVMGVSVASKIFLNPEVMSGLGEDTFWTWFQRETGAEVGVPRRIGSRDIVLHYSTMGAPSFPNQTINLLWELYPEMSLRLGKKFGSKNRRIKRSLAAHWHAVATPYSRAFYPVNAKVLPIAVNSDLFKPGESKSAAKVALGLDPNRPVAFWSGANHVMKGPDLRDAWLNKNPDWQSVVAPKENPISQEDLALRMQASDGFLNTSRLVPFYMIDWECIAADLPLIEAGGVEREFSLPSSNIRSVLFDKKWDRKSAIELWLKFIEECSLTLK
jgi:hypothetical protein